MDYTNSNPLISNLFKDNVDFFEKRINFFIEETTKYLKKWKEDRQEDERIYGKYPGVVIHISMDFNKSLLKGYTNLEDLFSICNELFTLNLVKDEHFNRNMIPYVVEE